MRTLALLVVVSLTGVAGGLQAPASSFTSRFEVDTADLGPTGRNPFFILEPNAREFKCYARGVGLLQDGSLKLVRYTQ